MSAQTYMPYVEPPKMPQKMSFFNEEQAATVWRIPNATEAMRAAARRVIARRPDADTLALMVFGAQA